MVGAPLGGFYCWWTITFIPRLSPQTMPSWFKATTFRGTNGDDWKRREPPPRGAAFSLAAFFFASRRRKEKSYQKRNAVKGVSPSADGEEGFAPPPHKLLKKLDQNFPCRAFAANHAIVV